MLLLLRHIALRRYAILRWHPVLLGRGVVCLWRWRCTVVCFNFLPILLLRRHAILLLLLIVLRSIVWLLSLRKATLLGHHRGSLRTRLGGRRCPRCRANFGDRGNDKNNAKVRDYVRRSCNEILCRVGRQCNNEIV